MITNHSNVLYLKYNFDLVALKRCNEERVIKFESKGKFENAHRSYKISFNRYFNFFFHSERPSLSLQGRFKSFLPLENYNRDPLSNQPLRLTRARRSNMQNTRGSGSFLNNLENARLGALGTIETRRSSNELCSFRKGEERHEERFEWHNGG